MSSILRKKHRAKRTKTIRSIKDVRWHFIYALPSEKTEEKLREVARIIYDFGESHNFFAENASPNNSHVEDQPQKRVIGNPTDTDILLMVCRHEMM